jgi:tetratricopeptide (TPR) repeat protein
LLKSLRTRLLIMARLLIKQNKFMRLEFSKKTIGFSSLIAVFIFSIPFSARAEKVFCKNGRTITGAILYRSNKSVWFKTNAGSAGVKIADIERIINDDGTVSKYDYVTLSREIQESIKKQDFNSALDHCSSLMQSFPGDNQLRYLRGSLSQKLGRFELAKEDYKYLIDNKAADAKVLNNLGAIYAKDGKGGQARELFLEALKTDPKLWEARENLAGLFMNSKDYSLAIAEYRKLLQADPANVKALYNLGDAYFNINDYSGAKEQWEKVLGFAPDDKYAKNALEFLKAKKLAD